MRQLIKPKETASKPLSILSNHVLWMGISIVLFVLHACNSSSANTVDAPPAAVSLPVVTLANLPATTYQEFSASLEGSSDIEIRPQVDGYLDRIFVDEGAYVRKGQVLFQINSRPYQEQLNNAQANLSAAQANLLSTDINVSKLAPLVESNVISEIQLKTAKASQAAAAASVAQARATVQNAAINVGYTQIKAPVDGYVGRIPFKTGSLVGLNTAEPLTVVSSIKDIYAYFSFSEKDFLRFKDQFEGTTIEDKIKKMPEIELVLADNSVYAQKGKVETVSGQFNNSMGAISFRATFKNPDGLLRSGITGKVRIPHLINTALAVPQEATFELQDKVFVFVVADSNKVISTPITIAGKSGNYYLVDKGLNQGAKIVYAGFDRLKDGTVIQPEQLSMDSLMKVNPL